MRISSRFRLAVIGAAVAAMGGLSPVAAGDGATPQDDAQDGSGANVIDIPGIGPIPIPLPPGSRVFGPRGMAPQARPAQPLSEPKSPAPARHAAVGVEELFARLASAEDADEARAVAASIQRLWARSGSDTADLLAARAELAKKRGEPAIAKNLLDYVLALEPGWAEALVRRANVRVELGDAEGARADFEHAVRLEPKRFDALAALGALEEANGRKRAALDAYRRSLEIDPKQDDVFKAEERLRLEVEGRDI
jgi:tetratricopeptide (TPR) repeat protein